MGHQHQVARDGREIYAQYEIWLPILQCRLDILEAESTMRVSRDGSVGVTIPGSVGFPQRMRRG